MASITLDGGISRLVTIHASGHRNRLFFGDHVAVSNRAVTDFAPDLGFSVMDIMREIHKVGKVVNPDPLNGCAGGPALPH